MYAAQYEEILSFISKFSYLSGQCINSNLNLSSYRGHVSVGLNVDLGSMMPPPFHGNHSKPSTRTKSSQICRRRRRQKERNLSSHKVSHKKEVLQNDVADLVISDDYDSTDEMLIQLEDYS